MGFTSLYDIDTLTLYEYEARMYAYRLKQVDEELKMHKQAWLNHQVTATKQQNKKQVPVFKKFKDFFDYEKELKKVEIKDDKISKENQRLARIAKMANERR